MEFKQKNRYLLFLKYCKINTIRLDKKKQKIATQASREAKEAESTLKKAELKSTKTTEIANNSDFTASFVVL